MNDGRLISYKTQVLMIGSTRFTTYPWVGEEINDYKNLNTLILALEDVEGRSREEEGGEWIADWNRRHKNNGRTVRGLVGWVSREFELKLETEKLRWISIYGSDLGSTFAEWL